MRVSGEGPEYDSDDSSFNGYLIGRLYRFLCIAKHSFFITLRGYKNISLHMRSKSRVYCDRNIILW